MIRRMARVATFQLAVLLRPAARLVRRLVGRMIVACAVVIALASSAMNLRPAPQQPPLVVQLAQLKTELELKVPAAALAGSPLSVSVNRFGIPDGTPVRLDVQAALLTGRILGTFQAGSASFRIPPELVVGSGLLVLTASTDRAIGRATVAVEPGGAADGITPLAGPRSIVADTKHWTMVSVIPGDLSGNGLADGTPVRVHARRPDGTVDIVEGSLQNLLDGIRVYSGTVAGLTTFRVEVMGATGPEIEIREVAGPPLPFALEASAGPLVADGRTLVEIRTPKLVDQYGNTVEDGTAVEIRGRAPDGPFRLGSTTIDGRALFRLRSPGVPGSVSLTADVAGTVSSPLEISFAPDALDFKVLFGRRGPDVSITIGPVRSSLGGFAPDGTPVDIEIPGQNTRRLQLTKGTATAVARLESGDQVTVKILGRSVDATAP
jgi:hypothetical protein